jgi:hypothetical protein
MRLFSPRKTTMLFVIRDKSRVMTCYVAAMLINCYNSFFSFSSLIICIFLINVSLFGFKQTPLENLEPILREDIQKVCVDLTFLLFCYTLFVFSQVR